jgi:putative ABC transport system permease protein
MFRNYFKIAWRNLIKNKVYSALIVLGLTTGMAVALLIGLWVHYQISYDRFLPGYRNIYKARVKYTINGEKQVGQATAYPLAAAIKNDIPGVKYVAQADWMGSHGLVAGEKKVYMEGAMAGEDFLNIFQYTLLKGNANNILKDPYSIVLTQSTAKSLFGSEDPINKTVRIDNSHDLRVTGLLRDLPGNSTFQFNYIVPFSFYTLSNDWVKATVTNWGNKSYQTFVALEPNVSYKQVEPDLKAVMKKYNPEEYKAVKAEVFMQPLKDWHLYADYKNGLTVGGFVEYVKMFSIIGLLVLLIACINFINLSTARSEKRAKEVGIRKVIGSVRRDLIFQFLIESLVITLIAFILSLGVVQLALPSFNTLTKTAISIPYSNGIFWCIMLSYVLITGLLAGSRPAFYLSSFKPIQVLKGNIRIGRAAALPRKILVMLQFSCSIALIISTIIVYQQLQYAKNRPSGYDANRLMMTDVSSDLSRNYTALKNDLLQSGLVTNVTQSSSPITDIWSHNSIDDWQGKQAGETLSIGTIGLNDADYFKTFAMQLKEGRNFTGDLRVDTLNVILNEAAVKRMRFKEPLNQIITYNSGKLQKLKVIGVVKDALMTSPFSPVEPSVFVYTPGWSNIITYRLVPKISTQQAIVKLTSIFNKYDPSAPYLYHFVDESYASKFNLETLVGKLAALFATLAIFISCLGLFGLAAYMAAQRNKEIGIRKVLGASVSQVWILFSKDFIILVFISCLIASPIAYYFLHDWLQKYDYRISIGAGVFIISALMAIVITIITISFQAIKAAIANPVKSLRME